MQLYDILQNILHLILLKYPVLKHWFRGMILIVMTCSEVFQSIDTPQFFLCGTINCPRTAALSSSKLNTTFPFSKAVNAPFHKNEIHANLFKPFANICTFDCIRCCLVCRLLLKFLGDKEHYVSSCWFAKIPEFLRATFKFAFLVFLQLLD